MRTRCLMLVGLLWFTVMPSATALAQLIQIRPGYVRAPFVRVYSYGDGSSYVRAPFVSVYSPPRRYVTRGYTHYGPPQPYGYDGRSTEPGSPRDLDWQALTPKQRKLRQLIAAKRQLDSQLAQINAPDSWQSFLHLTTDLIEAEATDVPPAPVSDDQRIALLEKALQRYDRIRDDAKYRVISNLPGFQSTHMRLGECIDILNGFPADFPAVDPEELPAPSPNIGQDPDEG